MALCILDDENNVLAVGQEWVGGFSKEMREDIKHLHGIDLLEEAAKILAQEFSRHDLTPQIETLLRQVQRSENEKGA